MLPAPPTTKPHGRPTPEVEHTRLRLRLLDGHALDDHRAYITSMVGPVRARAWGVPSRSVCPLDDLSSAVSVLYTLDPGVSHAADGDPERTAEIVEDVQERLRISGAWQAAAEAQRLTEALNECALHYEIDGGSILWRVVTPDLLEGVAQPGRPGEPALLREWRPREIDGEVRWCADEYDVRDPAAPSFRVLDEDGLDVTAQTLGLPQVTGPDGATTAGSYSGAGYPWRYSASPSYPDGRPFIPYRLTHSTAAPRRLFEPWRRVETVDATFEACLLSTMIGHVCRTAAFGITYAVGCRLAAEQIVNADGTVIARAPTLDPAMIHELEPTEPGVQPSIEVVRNETDPLMLMEVSERITARCAQAWGLGPSDIQRTAADSRSGVALAVSNEGRRRMQASRAPIYQPHDERMVGRLCALLNRAGIGGITDRPESGWVVTYTLSPLSPQERAQRQSEATDLYDRGVITRAEMRAIILGESPAQAAAALVAVAAERQPPIPTTTP
jgi:hypothetical protein